jgi:hypothetical protein
MIDWCLTPTLPVFRLYRGVEKNYKLTSTSTRFRNKTLMIQICVQLKVKYKNAY